MSSSTIRILDVPEIADAMPLPATRTPQGGLAFDAPRTLERILHWVAGAGRHVAGTLKTQRSAKAMRLCETISLGDKRFLAIVQVDEERILIGGSASSVALLTRLPEKQPFAAVLLERSQPVRSA